MQAIIADHDEKLIADNRNSQYPYLPRRLFGRLPTELWLEVLDHLEPTERASLALSSKFFQNLLLSEKDLLLDQNQRARLLHLLRRDPPSGLACIRCQRVYQAPNAQPYIHLLRRGKGLRLTRSKMLCKECWYQVLWKPAQLPIEMNWQDVWSHSCTIKLHGNSVLLSISSTLKMTRLRFDSHEKWSSDASLRKLARCNWCCETIGSQINMVNFRFMRVGFKDGPHYVRSWRDCFRQCRSCTICGALYSFNIRHETTFDTFEVKRFHDLGCREQMQHWLAGGGEYAFCDTPGARYTPRGQVLAMAQPDLLRLGDIGWLGYLDRAHLKWSLRVADARAMLVKLVYSFVSREKNKDV